MPLTAPALTILDRTPVTIVVSVGDASGGDPEGGDRPYSLYVGWSDNADLIGETLHAVDVDIPYTIDNLEADVPYWVRTKVVDAFNTFAWGAATKVATDIVVEIDSSISYLLLDEADALAANMLNLSSYQAALTSVRTKALIQATERIDASMRFQGRKFDPTQTLEFPRLARDNAPVGGGVVGVPNYPLTNRIAAEIWDLDPTTHQAVVPLKVKRAVLYEANSIIKGTRAGRLDDLHDGLASQSVGNLSESYSPVNAAGRPMLCRQADELLRHYRLQSGGLR